VALALTSSPDVRGAQVLPLRDPDLARVSVATTHGPADDRTEALVRDLREGELHASLEGVRYDVGG
jgi:RND superfamily putative drug exporter